MKLLNALITFIRQTFALGMKVDSFSLKQLEIMPPSFAKKRADNPSTRLLNDQLAFERGRFFLPE
jgi:hypothetical protein